MKKWMGLVLLVMLVLLAAGCQNQEKKVVIASKPMAESYIIAEMMGQLIEANSDIKVEYKMGIGGGTSNIQPAMEAGEIDMYPEYTGTGWLFVLKNELVTDPETLYEGVKSQYQEKYNFAWLDRYGFNDTYALAMDKSKADSMGINTFSDLAAQSNNLSLGAEYDFYEREDGYPGLVTAYGFNFKETKELDIGLKYKAIGEGQVDVINNFSTDGLLAEYDLKVLKDDKGFFPAYEAATVIRQETLDKYPELEGILNKLAGQISDEEMQQMNYYVEKENRDAGDVAAEFLKAKGLL
ncbi:glycine betaine ABC transporter substrate-binding protein [Acetobacterium wieringae]|uniref:glycine betaine ABC transporter substrate-binding protein n=1 Tax=Acetobacterium wieringae TaxID=52694 RepID=UPI00203438C8|nr:glycine betaine ABC transporter substrate-binding protein [Acetobacterium wieringae]MEA4806666.1 glycine betaine ABC transporter substrate-binding protein [Acetobacterium wieringae]URN85602.1 glycine/betaine ABC transporter substrate-binding protein [Acetobacterium wieringae]